jgi:hypothetical protein
LISFKTKKYQTNVLEMKTNLFPTQFFKVFCWNDKYKVHEILIYCKALLMKTAFTDDFKLHSIPRQTMTTIFDWEIKDLGFKQAKLVLKFLRVRYISLVCAQYLQGIWIWFISLKQSCDSRFQRAFTACCCVFKIITLAWANQRNYSENVNACSKRLSQLR